MTNISTQRQTHPFANILALLERMSSQPNPLDADTPIARATAEFLRNNFEEARIGILAKTNKIIVEPEPSPTPRVFHFHIFRPYKCKEALLDPVELNPGPIRGAIFYRQDLFQPDDNGPVVAVRLHDGGFFHPNFSRRHGFLCLGALPPGPIALEHLITHLYSILSYQNLHVTDPADAEAAEYFSTHPEALTGLENVEPLY